MSNKFFSSSQDDQSDRKDKLDKTAKNLKQAKLASLYGSNLNRQSTRPCKNSLSSRSNDSEDCVISDKTHPICSHPKSTILSPFPKVEEERSHGNALGAKRVHMEIGSPGNDIGKSPSNDEESNGHVAGNGFVTARAKLVSACFLQPISLFNKIFSQLNYSLFFFIYCGQHYFLIWKEYSTSIV